MVHYFECDNCGRTVKTGCFDESGVIVHYYVPPLPTMSQQYTFKEYMAEAAARKIISICKECKEQ